MSDTTVKYFNSSMSGAPSLTNVAGAVIGILDACLQTGFGSVTLTSLVVATNVATATVNAGHNFAMVGNAGPVITIAGATPSGLNGQWRVTVTSATQFTFATTGISDQTATGTITAKRSPAGWTKIYSGTNLAAYQADDVTSTRFPIRIDDTGTTYTRVVGYEAMSSINSGTNPFPTEAQVSGGLYLSRTANAGAKAWTLVADGKMFYLFDDSQNAYYTTLAFGDTLPLMGADAFPCFIQAAGTAGLDSFYAANSLSIAGHYMARSYTQTGTAKQVGKYSHARSSNLGTNGMSYPAPMDNGFFCTPIEIWEDSPQQIRSILPGVWNPLTVSLVAHGTVVDNVARLTSSNNNTLIFQNLAFSYRAVLDLTGPWR